MLTNLRNGSGNTQRRRIIASLVVLIGLAWSVAAMGQPHAPRSGADRNIVLQRDGGTGAPPAATAPKDPVTDYNYWVLAPAVVAILLAIIIRQVIPALIVGILVGAYMLLPCLPASDAFAQGNSAVNGFRLAAERYMMGAILDPSEQYGHLKIMIFTLVIGFTVGVMGRSGGTAGMVKLVAGSAESPRRSGLTAWLAGLVVFFDDYANTMIIGPTMRSVFDRVKLSRAKLAYIVDSTAAPVASLALIGTWVGAEIGYIETGIKSVVADGAPAFLINDQGQTITGMQAFISSLPYRFYPILALFLVFLIALTGRDFGPMKKAESRALVGDDDGAMDSSWHSDSGDEPKPRWWLGLFPVLVLVGATVAILYITGYAATGGAEVMQSQMPFWEKLYKIIGGSDSYVSIFYGAVFAAIVAVLLTMIARACALRDAVDAGLDGMARMFPAVVILILAWGLSAVEQELQLGEVVKNGLEASNFPIYWMPLAIFISAALISFATGTSWGTMGILCPATVIIIAKLAADMDASDALPLFSAAIGSVLAGAVFGDHCSPISDTTVLSSIASGCRHEVHVWTQIPYALVTAVAAMGLGDLMCSVYKQPWYVGLGAGAGLLLLVVLIVGRQAKPMEPAFSAMP